MSSNTETHTLLDVLRREHTPFLVARIILKLGREIPDQFASPEDDHEMAELIRRICQQLGVKYLA